MTFKGTLSHQCIKVYFGVLVRVDDGFGRGQREERMILHVAVVDNQIRFKQGVEDY